MSHNELTRLEIALGLDQPLPWPSSLAQDIAMEERRLQAEAHGPARRRKGSEVARVFELLDQLETERTGSR